MYVFVDYFNWLDYTSWKFSPTFYFFFWLIICKIALMFSFLLLLLFKSKWDQFQPHIVVLFFSFTQKKGVIFLINIDYNTNMKNMNKHRVQFKFKLKFSYIIRQQTKIQIPYQSHIVIPYDQIFSYIYIWTHYFPLIYIYILWDFSFKKKEKKM